MARPNKPGLDYFPLDTDFFANPKVRRIKMHCGPHAVAVLLNLLCTIYRGGYYAKWTMDSSLLVAEDVGIKEEEVDAVIQRCFEVDFLSREMFQLHRVLTSREIQQRYAKVCASSKRALCINEYNLISSEETRVNSEETRVNSELFRNNPHISVNNGDSLPETAVAASSMPEKEENVEEKAIFAPKDEVSETIPEGVSSEETRVNSEETRVNSEETTPIKEKKRKYPPRNSPLPDDVRRRRDFSASSSGGAGGVGARDLTEELREAKVDEDGVAELARLCNNFEDGHVGTRTLRMWLAHPGGMKYWEVLQQLQQMENQGLITVSMPRGSASVQRFLRKHLKPSDYQVAVSLITDPMVFAECEGLVKDCMGGKIKKPGAFIMSKLYKMSNSQNIQA